MELIFHFCHCFDFIFLAGQEKERRKEELLKIIIILYGGYQNLKFSNQDPP
jgi:hypothetical protein